MLNDTDTIAAVATAPGLGGIGIIRISGSLAISIIRTLFKRPQELRRDAHQTNDSISYQLKHRKLNYGYIVDPDSGTVLDEVFVAVMRAPHSYTREDVAEIQSHAGSAVLQNILSHVISAGARLAEAGEFTRRAFLHGRIDLTQAEAVADLINAKTQEAMAMAANQLTGGMLKRVEIVRNKLQMAAGFFEALIEFPEEMSDETEALSNFQTVAQTARTDIQTLLQAFRESHIYRDGIQVSVVGRPNVGKSSLLNALLEKERAIVTALPGTTRDIVIDSFQVEGIPIQIADTAGIQTSRDTIEQIGIRKTEESIAVAQLILFVVDAQAGYRPEDEKIYIQLENKISLLVINKIDLVDEVPPIPKWMHINTPHVSVSAKYQQNIATLKKQMAGLISSGNSRPPSDMVVPNLRQKRAFERAEKELSDAISASQAGVSEEFVVFHLHCALNSLGTITGETHSDDLLDLIFDRFCIGK